MRFRNLFSWASASGTWLLPQTKNIFCRPTACRTTSPSSTWQISRSPRRSRSASFLGVSQFPSSDIEAFDFETKSYRTPICKKRDGDGAEYETYAAFEKLVAEQFGVVPDGAIK